MINDVMSYCDKICYSININDKIVTITSRNLIDIFTNDECHRQCLM